jgi:hypothetical protein
MLPLAAKGGEKRYSRLADAIAKRGGTVVAELLAVSDPSDSSPKQGIVAAMRLPRLVACLSLSGGVKLVRN